MCTVYISHGLRGGAEVIHDQHVDRVYVSHVRVLCIAALKIWIVLHDSIASDKVFAGFNRLRGPPQKDPKVINLQYYIFTYIIKINNPEIG